MEEKRYDNLKRAIKLFMGYPGIVFIYHFDIALFEAYQINKFEKLFKPENNEEKFLITVFKDYKKKIEEIPDFEETILQGYKELRIAPSILAPYFFHHKLDKEKGIKAEDLKQFAYGFILYKLSDKRFTEAIINRHKKPNSLYQTQFVDILGQLLGYIKNKLENKNFGLFCEDLLKRLELFLSETKYEKPLEKGILKAFFQEFFEVFINKNDINQLEYWIKNFPFDIEYFPVFNSNEVDLREKYFVKLFEHYKKYFIQEFDLDNLGNDPEIIELAKKSIVNKIGDVQPDTELKYLSQKLMPQLYRELSFFLINIHARNKALFFLKNSLKNRPSVKVGIKFHPKNVALWVLMGSEIGIFKSSREGFKFFNENFIYEETGNEQSFSLDNFYNYKKQLTDEIKNELKKIKDLVEKNQVFDLNK